MHSSQNERKFIETHRVKPRKEMKIKPKKKVKTNPPPKLNLKLEKYKYIQLELHTE